MNIAHFGKFSGAAVNGVATAGFWLAQAQVNLGHQVSIYTLDSLARDFSEFGISQKQFVPSKRAFRLPEALEAAIDQRKDKIDIFHLHSVFTPANFAMSRFLKKKGVPFVLTPNGGYDVHIFRKNRLKKFLYWHLFEKHCLYTANGVICVTEREIADIRAIGYKSTITVVPNAVRNDALPSRKMEPALDFLGRWDINHKGLDRLLKLFRHIESIDPAIRLRLYGSGQQAELENYIKRLEIKNVELCGPVFGSAKWSVLSRAAVYIQPSRWEVFGVSIAEAMMAGVPVAVARECYLSDAVARVGCGLVLDEYDLQTAQLLCDLVHDRDSNHAMGDKGRAYSSTAFDARVVAQQTCDFYRVVLGAR